MAALLDEVINLQTTDDVVKARHLVREGAVVQGLSLIEQTKLITAVSELARNTVIHGGGGTMQMELDTEGLRPRVKLVFTDQGHGILDIQLAMKDGYSTGGGLGLGLSGTKRLVNEFAIQSTPGEGTRVTIAKWALAR